MVRESGLVNPGDVSPAPYAGSYDITFVSINGLGLPAVQGLNFLRAYIASEANLGLGKGGDPVSLASGDYTYSHTDIAIPGRGVGLNFTRSYHSASDVERTVGRDWSQPYDMYLDIQSNVVTVFYPAGHGTEFLLDGGQYVPPDFVEDQLVDNGNSTYTLTTKLQIEFDFDATGKLTAITDRNGNVTTLSYDVNGDLDKVTDASGLRSLDFTVDAATGRITKITDPLNRTVEFTYDAGGDLTQVKNLFGGTTTYTYVADGLKTLTDANSNQQLENFCDTDGRVAEQHDAFTTPGVMCYYYGTGATYTSTGCPGVTPAPTSVQTIFVDQLGRKTTYEFDSFWRVEKVTDALGGFTQYTYDADGRIATVTDPNMNTTTLTYDANGNVLTREDPLMKTWTYTYNAFNDVLTAEDPVNPATTYVYGVDGNLDTITDADGKVTDFAVDANGRVTSVLDARLNTTTYGYDVYGNRTSVTNALTPAQTWTYEFDLVGRLTKVTDPLTP